MRVVFDDRAVEDLEDIYRFISAENPHAARSVVLRIVASVERLADFPRMARNGQVEDTREWVMPRLPYIAVYRVYAERDEVVIVGVFHGARERPERD
ncbi:type II toxin-antitoxin system RelE/ParE family toxin [Pseudorhodoplanes sp.]|uniref:type II toxin-antitoxin system RelE/ParE family toxin n=1 Tax=Pseudorhodoplanes sp. TaxID=1934341 RepID=UPI0039194596